MTKITNLEMNVRLLLLHSPDERELFLSKQTAKRRKQIENAMKKAPAKI